MPELPEVETIKNQLLDKICGKKIKQVEIRLAKIIKGVPVNDFKQRVPGATVKNVRRRAKLLIIELNNGYGLLIHLKLTGQLIFIKTLKHENIKTFTHLIYYFSDQSCLLHNDLRQFGYVKLIKTADLENIFLKEKLGPEPLSKSFSLEKFKELLSAKPRAKIKPLLMDQSFIAGVGNVYAQEACWCSRILPTRIVKSLKEKEIARLYNCLLKILKEAIKYKGSSVDTYVDINGEQGSYISKLKVYARENEKCWRCGGKIKKMTLAGRGICFCSHCQK